MSVHVATQVLVLFPTMTPESTGTEKERISLGLETELFPHSVTAE